MDYNFRRERERKYLVLKKSANLELARTQNSHVDGKECFLALFIFILTRGFFIYFLHLSSDRAGGGQEGRERQKHQCERDKSSGCHPHNPNRGRVQLQPRYMPLTGTEPGTLWSAGCRPNR
uniref:Uncharacterized protein n=1 Tax=Molossus molossus TaxID=27622 RepID=A0A7J8CRQ2_MOLMO|nr:hypothetical protein HJG59_009752 [Molossus molossus]